MPESRPTKSDPFNHKVESAKWTFVDGDDPDALAEFAGRMAEHINAYWTSPWHDRAQAFLDFADGILEPDPPGQYGTTEPRRLLNELRGWILTWKATQDPAHIFEAGRAFEALRIFLTSDCLSRGRAVLQGTAKGKATKAQAARDAILDAAETLSSENPKRYRKRNRKPNKSALVEGMERHADRLFPGGEMPLTRESARRVLVSFTGEPAEK